ncbi:hypothetical protein B0J17DRAFT_706217 [Rhizoctonia solani]|nr:hypothetical protein B0J17DRAFT_706217 [Rhizoctonia solani]
MIEPQLNIPTAPEVAELSTNTVTNGPPTYSEQTQTIVESNQQAAGVSPAEPTTATKKRPRKNKEDKEPAKKNTKTKKAVVAGASDLTASNNGSVLPVEPTPPKNVSNQTNAFCHGLNMPQEHSIAPRFRRDISATAQLIPAQDSIPSTTRPHVSDPRPVTDQNQTKEPVQSIPLAPARKPQTYNPKTFKSPAILRPPRTNHNPSKPPVPEPVSCSEQSLDFPAPEPCTSFPLITMPPSTARRRQAERMSVIFSGITDDKVLGLCARVSRAWRYAVYLSATHTLYRDFSGTRLDSIRLQIQEPRMTNMWTYLRARRFEVTTRYGAFERSWLGRFFATEMSGYEPVSWRIWTSPDDDRQAAVALRFISTRMVFSFAKRYSECDQSWVNLVERVVGAEEIVPDEIWKVTTSSPAGKLNSFHILYDTGEVIGLAPPPPRCGIIGRRIKHRPHIEVLDFEPGGLREDWRGYILSVGSGPNLQDVITSGDRESYIAGVSVSWLRSLSLEESTRRIVAKRYVLNCVEPNSISGKYKSVVDMAGDVAGVLSNTGPRRQVGLYISEHHLVESVHLPSSLHPALAMVTTAPGREYFVLRDTGMPIGTSDQGLEPLWQTLIGCDAWGSGQSYSTLLARITYAASFVG